MRKTSESAGEHFRDEGAARLFLEGLRWPDGAVCPHCGAAGRSKRLPPPSRLGLYQCNSCRKQFSVTVGTMFADSNIPLHKWLRAVDLMCSEPDGVNPTDIHRELQLGSYRSAWLLCHRVRWALTQRPIKRLMKAALKAHAPLKVYAPKA